MRADLGAGVSGSRARQSLPHRSLRRPGVVVTRETRGDAETVSVMFRSDYEQERIGGSVTVSPGSADCEMEDSFATCGCRLVSVSAGVVSSALSNPGI